MTESQAFLDHNFASPTLRRNIGILGMLHKRTLGMCHPMMEKLLPTWQQKFGRQRPDKHDKQLYGNFLEVHWQRGLFDRSIFAMCSVYNDLPQYVVDAPTVSVFQKHLTHIARTRCKNNFFFCVQPLQKDNHHNTMSLTEKLHRRRRTKH